jgi:hypothetical protein
MSIIIIDNAPSLPFVHEFQIDSKMYQMVNDGIKAAFYVIIRLAVFLVVGCEGINGFMY